MWIACVIVDRHNWTAFGYKALPFKLAEDPVANRQLIHAAIHFLADEAEGFPPDAVNSPPGLSMRFKLCRVETRLEFLNQFRRADDLNTLRADQFHRAGVHHRDIRQSA